MKTSDQEPQRLQKILADSGRWSRREAEELIRDGAVTINGKVAAIGSKAIFGKDHIKVLGKLLQFKKERVAYALFKPRGIFAQPSTEENPREVGTVFGLLPDLKYRLLPIGRLDRDAEGIMLFTNDGDLAGRLNVGRYEVPRTYMVKIDGHLTPVQERRLLHGLKVEEKKLRLKEFVPQRKTEGKQWIRVTLTHPGHRVVKKLFEGVGHPVDKIRRESFAGISLRGLDRGSYRKLSEEELSQLCASVGL